MHARSGGVCLALVLSLAATAHAEPAPPVPSFSPPVAAERADNAGGGWASLVAKSKQLLLGVPLSSDATPLRLTLLSDQCRTDAIERCRGKGLNGLELVLRGEF